MKLFKVGTSAESGLACLLRVRVALPSGAPARMRKVYLENSSRGDAIVGPRYADIRKTILRVPRNSDTTLDL